MIHGAADTLPSLAGRKSALGKLRLTVLLFCALLLCRSVALAAGEVVSGEFEMIDHTGRPVDQSSYDNKLRLMFFGFTRCPIICPTTMLEVSRAMHMLGERASEVQPLFVSIDPEHDSVEVVAEYVRAFHPSVIGLTGSAEQVRNAAEAFNVTYGKTAIGDARELTEMFHSSYLYLMDRQGKFVDVFGYGTKPDVILAKLEEYL